MRIWKSYLYAHISGRATVAEMCIRDRGKGIKYADEVIRRKVGKTGKK